MYTLYDEILDILEGEEDAVVMIRTFEGYIYDDPRNPDGVPFDKELTLAEAKEWLNYKYDRGYGGGDCHHLYVWTPTRVISTREYNGSCWLEAVPRNPGDRWA